MSQQEIAESLNISQQAISTWMTGKRKPTPIIQQLLLRFASRHGIKAREAEPVFSEMKRFMNSRNGQEFAKLICLYAQMPPKDKKRILRYAEKLI